jgi:hypothetical protein
MHDTGQHVCYIAEWYSDDLTKQKVGVAALTLAVQRECTIGRPV